MTGRWLALALAACEAQPIVSVTFRPPVDPAQLHVELQSKIGDGWTEWGPGFARSERVAPDGIECAFDLAIGTHETVRIRGWYDTNGNGRRDPGEPFGELGSGFEAVDHGGCSEREPNRAPDIVLVTAW